MSTCDSKSLIRNFKGSSTSSLLKLRDLLKFSTLRMVKLF